MAHFSYEARSRTGEHFAGAVEAASRREAAREIRQRGLWVASLTRLEQAERKESLSGLRRLLASACARPVFSRRLPSGRRACVLFLRQLALLTSAGLPLHEALGAMQAGDGRRDGYEEMVGALRGQVLAGTSLSAALSAYPAVFPHSVCQLIALGEAGGALASILPELADHMELAMKTRAKLRAAMAYPVLLFFVTLLAGTLMTVFLLPAFAALLTSLAAELPWPTRVLLALSAFLQQHGAATAALFAVSCVFFGWLFSRPGLRQRLDRLFLGLPFFGTLLRYGEWQIILSLLAVLLHHGVPLDRALALAMEAPRNAFLRLSLQRAHARLRRGKPLTAALRGAMLPSFLMALLRSGEAAGRLEEMMQRGAGLARFCYEERLRRLEVLVEPVLTLVVGAMIFFFVLAVMLPLLTTMDALG